MAASDILSKETFDILEKRLAEPNDTFQKYRNVFGRIADKMPVSNGPRIIIAFNPDQDSWKEKIFSYNKKSDHGK